MKKSEKDFYSSVEHLRECQSKKTEAKKQLENWAVETNKAIANKRDKGLQYYDYNKRMEILKFDIEHGYSKKDIDELKKFEDNNAWNQDNVTCAIIDNLMQAEAYYKQNYNPPKYKQKIFYKIGKMFIGNNKGEKDNNDN